MSKAALRATFRLTMSRAVSVHQRKTSLIEPAYKLFFKDLRNKKMFGCGSVVTGKAIGLDFAFLRVAK